MASVVRQFAIFFVLFLLYLDCTSLSNTDNTPLGLDCSLLGAIAMHYAHSGLGLGLGLSLGLG